VLEKRVREEEVAGCTFRPQIGTLPSTWEYARKSPDTSQDLLEALTSTEHLTQNEGIAINTEGIEE
jgi:hypothetical protein